MEIQLEGKSFVTFCNWMKAIKCIAEEITLVLDPKGMKVLTMDPSHVAMVDAKIASKVFGDYSIEGEKETCAFNLSEFLKFLDRLDQKQRVTLSLNVERAKLILNGKLRGRTRRFELPILNEEEEEVPQPKINFTSEVKMTLDSVSEATMDVNLVSQHVVIKLTEELVSITGQGDMGDAFGEWEKDSDDVLSLKVEEEALATFTLSYILDMVKALKGTAEEVVDISMTTDMPIKLEAHGDRVEVSVDQPEEQNTWDLVYYLAPCIGA